MSSDQIPDVLNQSDDFDVQIERVADRLYRGEGGAAELAGLIAQQAKMIARNRIEAAKRRALEAA